jgi:hypothetical protein
MLYPVQVGGVLRVLQHYVVKFVSDLWQVGGVLRVLQHYVVKFVSDLWQDGGEKTTDLS